MSGLRQFIIGTAVLALFAAGSAVRAQDVLELKRQEDILQGQQTAKDVAAAIEKSKELEKSSAGQAKTLLDQSLLQVNDSAGLTEQKRAELQQSLRTRLREVEATAREQRLAGDQSAKIAADKAAREERDRVAKSQGGNQSAYNQAKEKIDATNNIRDQYGAANKTMSKNFTDQGLDIAKSAAKGQKEERITKEFIALSERRKPQLTKEETALLKALNSTITADFETTKYKFKEVLQWFSDKAGIELLPDTMSLKDANIEYDTDVVPFKVKANVRTVLKKVLGDLGLTYFIDKGNIQIITPDRMKDHLVTRAYPVSDLVMPVNTTQFKNNPLGMMLYTRQQAMQLIQTIVSTIEPQSWQGVGERGYATITYNDATKSIVITHTAEMHYSLGGALGR